jgi:hypothetical protein
MMGSLGNMEVVVNFLSYIARKRVELLRRSIAPFSRERVKRCFLISNVSAGNILCSRQHVARELQVGQACARVTLPIDELPVKRTFTVCSRPDFVKIQPMAMFRYYEKYNLWQCSDMKNMAVH